MITPPSQRIGIVTCGADKLADYFPTAAEPEFVPTEPPFTPDDQLLVDELRRRGHQVSAVVWGVEISRLPPTRNVSLVRSTCDGKRLRSTSSSFARRLQGIRLAFQGRNFVQTGLFIGRAAERSRFIDALLRSFFCLCKFLRRDFGGRAGKFS